MYGRANYIIIIIFFSFLAGCSAQHSPAPVKKLYQGRSIHDYERASLKQDKYQVQQGDTFYSIAFRANQDIRALAQRNNIREPYTIFPGQVIHLTSKKPATEIVAKTQNKGYVNTEVKHKSRQNNQNKPKTNNQATRKPVKVATQAKPQPTPIATSAAEPYKKDLNWQWPATGNVFREFSTAATGSKGVDISGQRNDPIYAAEAGKVVYAGNALKGYGQLIILKHNDDYISAYAHNHRLLVKEQQWVKKGDEIAKMGDSDAAQVMLHFEIRFRGKSVNPRHYLPRGKK